MILIHNSKNKERKYGFAIYVPANTTGQKRYMATDDEYYQWSFRQSWNG